MTIFC